MVDSMSYDEQLAEMENILRLGIEKILIFAKEKNFLDAPYGRKQYPTPLITEEHFVKVGGLHCDDEEPEFEFEYGFDPLKFLSDYILWAHPDSVRERRQAKSKAQERLAFRVQHAIHQVHVQETLKKRVKSLMSGIQWGPSSLALTPTNTRCLLKGIKNGIIYLQISHERDFSTILKTFKILVKSSQIQNKNDLYKYIDIPKLESQQLYYVRGINIISDDLSEEKSAQPVTVIDTDDGELTFVNEQSIYANISSFWTLPSDSLNFINSEDMTSYSEDEDEIFKLQFIGQVRLSSLNKIKPQTSDDDSTEEQTYSSPNPTYSCLLGDLFDHSKVSNVFEDYHHQLDVLMAKLLDSSENRSSNLFLAWRDGSASSGQNFKIEETIFKQYRHDIKKYNKKHGLDDKSKRKSTKPTLGKQPSLPPPPTLKRPPISHQLNATFLGFPQVPMEDLPNEPPQACRMLYREVKLTSDVQLIILDMRKMQGKTSFGCDYLGKEQAEWLDYILQNSPCPWKIIASAKSFGVCQVKQKEEGQSSTPNIILSHEPSRSNLNTPHSHNGSFDEGNNILSRPRTSDYPADEEEKRNHSSSISSLIRKGSAKQVSLNLPEGGVDLEKPYLYDETDEIFGRSKYSLQHVLAEYQSKDPKYCKDAMSSSLRSTGEIGVQSGIVIFSGGITSSLSFIPPPNASVDDQDFVDSIDDVQFPPFVAGYHSLTSSVPESSLLRTPSSPLDKRIPFCVEFGLGHWSSKVEGTSLNPEIYHRQQYLTGFEGYTFFFSDSAEVNTTQCELAYKANGRLQIQMFASSFPETSIQTKTPLFECTLKLQSTKEDDSGSSEDDESTSIYVA